MLLVFQIPIMVVATVVAAIILGYGFWGEPFFYIPIAVLAGFILAFLLGRRGWYKTGTALSITCMYGGIWTAIILNPIPAYVSFDLLLIALLLPVFTVGLFFSLGTLIVFVLVNLVLVWFLPALIGVHILMYLATLIVMASLSAVAIVAIYHRNRQEAMRLLALSSSEARLTEAEEMAHLGSWEWDLATDELIWSQAEYGVIGFEPGERVTLDMFMERVHPDDRERIEAANRDILKAEQPIITEFRIVHPERGDRHIYSLAKPVKDASGRVVKVVGIEQDMTEQIQAREELRQAKEAAEEALRQVKQLEGLLPICSYCKKIRADDDAWLQLEHYISEHSEAEFSHGVCPDCYAEHLAPQLGKGKQKGSHSHEH
jgi:PAS domain S-box-containing protein